MARMQGHAAARPELLHDQQPADQRGELLEGWLLPKKQVSSTVTSAHVALTATPS